MRPTTVLRAALTLVVISNAASAQLKRSAPSGLTDAEFWDFFTSMSEPGGSFASENFVSNEVSFQYVIPTLQKTVSKDAAYLGVGPEQNFTYIANLKPRMAVIFDIRRQNAMAHLMYKAMFEMSPTRGDFVSHLFSRPLTGRVATTAKVADMFSVAEAAAPSDSAYDANQKAVFASLVNKHHFVLTPGDSAAIEHLMEVFYEAGPSINYGYRPGNRFRQIAAFPTYGYLQTLTNADSVQTAFLANEDLYRTVRDMHLRNLIVPVVGDFAGPKAIKSVGEYLKQHGMTVGAFYTSNVEQYLFQNDVDGRFYDNLAALPIDSGSTIIRSVPPQGAMNLSGGFSTYTLGVGGGGIIVRGGSIAPVPMPNAVGGGVAIGGMPNSGGGISIVGPNGVFFGSNATSISMSNANGRREITVVTDTAGQRITRTYLDSAGVLVPLSTRIMSQTQVDSAARAQIARQDSLIQRLLPSAGAVQAGNVPGAVRVMGGTLVSGLAPIRKTVDMHKANQLETYRDVIAMTKIDAWK